MAKENEKGSPSGVDQSATPAAGSATPKKRANRQSLDHLGEKERFALRVVLQARSACNTLADKIKRGQIPSGEEMQACSLLSGAIAKDMFA